MVTSTKPKVLLVDDNLNLLQALVRHLHTKYELALAQGGEEALTLIDPDDPFTVIVSDMRMPGMNGIQFLAQAREKCAHAVRIMLTGNAEIETAMHAVNEGNVFRFLIKPCRVDILEWAIDAAVEQHRLLTAERELLEQTLKGSVQILIDILSLVNPTAFGRASRVKDYVSQIARNLGVKNAWQYELAALLSHVGCVAVPRDILAKAYSGLALTSDEQQIYDTYPDAGQNLLARVPRMESVRDMIAFQQMSLAQIAKPHEDICRDTTYFGAQLLRTCTQFDTLLCSGKTRLQALTAMKCQPKEYLPVLLRALDDVRTISAGENVRSVSIKELHDSMVLADKIETRSGVLIAPAGQHVTVSLRALLRNYLRRNEIGKEIRVLEITERNETAQTRETAAVPS